MNTASIYVSADTIKTLDMALPSYDSISSSSASVETVEGLAQEFVEVPEARAPRKPKAKKEPSGGGGGNPLGGVLPSMNKGPKNQSQNKKAAPKPKPARKEKEEKVPEYETMDLSLPSYSGGAAAREKSIFSL